MNKILLKERQFGCVVGGAIGDAFGYEIEFDSISGIHRKYGENGLIEPVYHNGKLIVSDDTQMTLFTLEAMLDQAASNSTSAMVERIRQAYLDWYSTQGYRSASAGRYGRIVEYPEMHHARAPGNCCMTSLSAGGNGSPEKPINDNKGCGGVMRVAPVGLFPEDWDIEEVFEIAMRAAAITHTHPTGFLSAGTLAVIIRNLIDGYSLREAIDAAIAMLRQFRGFEETLDAVNHAIQLSQQDMLPIKAIELLGEGWIAEEALAIGIYSVLKAESFKQTIRIAANHSGDSDSTASIAGQIYGAGYGLAGIPYKWLRSLDVSSVIDKLLNNQFNQ